MNSPLNPGNGPVRLRCGVVFTRAFVAHLREFFAEGRGENPGMVPVIGYVKFAEGRRAGEEWWSLRWENATAYETEEGIFEEAGVPIGLSKQTRRGLGSKFVDIEDGKIIVG
ncbi:MAG: hypothetical protein AAGJ79_03815 [Verrucomicrobiota bacterium]